MSVKTVVLYVVQGKPESHRPWLDEVEYSDVEDARAYVREQGPPITHMPIRIVERTVITVDEVMP